METPKLTGAELIAKERARQISDEGWTAEHDDQHTKDEFTRAAGCYLCAAQTVIHDGESAPGILGLWPWDAEWWKPSVDAIRNMEKAGALIAAEIDRLQRKKEREKEDQNDG